MYPSRVSITVQFSCIQLVRSSYSVERVDLWVFTHHGRHAHINRGLTSPLVLAHHVCVHIQGSVSYAYLWLSSGQDVSLVASKRVEIFKTSHTRTQESPFFPKTEGRQGVSNRILTKGWCVCCSANERSRGMAHLVSSGTGEPVFGIPVSDSGQGLPQEVQVQ
jgi:hypothetical protein